MGDRFVHRLHKEAKSQTWPWSLRVDASFRETYVSFQYSLTKGGAEGVGVGQLKVLVMTSSLTLIVTSFLAVVMLSFSDAVAGQAVQEDAHTIQV